MKKGLCLLMLSVGSVAALTGGVSSTAAGKDLKSIIEARNRSLKKKSFHLGSIEVILSENDRTSPGIPEAIGTDSRVETRKAGKTVGVLDFKGLDAVGGYTGLLLPEMQPLKDYLILRTLGNYDSRLILIDPQGGIHNLPYGQVYLSPPSDSAHRLLLAIRTTPRESGEFALFDLNGRKPLIHQADDVKAVEFDKASRVFKEGIVYQPFYQGGKYFVLATEKDPAKPELARELAPTSFVRLNDPMTEFISEKRDPGYSVGAVALKELLSLDAAWVTFRKD